MSASSDTPTDDDEFDLVEIESEHVDEEGNVVIDDVVAVMDSEGHLIATDETITEMTAEGDLVIDESFSVVGEDGELHEISDDVTVLVADDEEPSGSS